MKYSFELTPDQERLYELADGRLMIAEIAKLLDMPATTVRKRLQEMRRTGHIVFTRCPKWWL